MKKITPYSILSKSLVWSWVLISLLPVFFILTTSLKSTDIAREMPPRWFFIPSIRNYQKILVGGGGQSVGFNRLLLNSLIVTLGSTILCIAIALPAAYALSRAEFRSRKALSSWILSTYMFPPIVAVIPIFIFAGNLHLLDTYVVLAVPYAAFNLPIVIWILRSSLEQIPPEIEEAARIDGASGIYLATQILLPLLIPAIATGVILGSILSWNDFLFALSLTRSAAKTSPVGIQEFTGMYGTDWGSLSAAAMTIVAPVLILAMVARRRIVSGLTFGAVK